MTYQKYLIAGAISAIGLLAASTANASYMSDCNKLITKWKNCTETGQKCTTEFKTIEVECKCHAFKQGEWKLVMAAVGKDGVCAPPWPWNPPPPDPSPPPHDDGRTSNGDKGNGDRKNDERTND